MPLYPGSPTDWSNLYTSLKLAQGINTDITGCKQTIITLDLQLYAKAMQLREKNEIRESFIFRLGELHIVFAMLKCLGKYIEDSGLDRLFIEAGVFGDCTLGQILAGKHMKRAMEAHMTLYLSLYGLYLKSFLEKFPETLETISEIKSRKTSMKEHIEKNNKEEVKISHQTLNDIFESIDDKLKVHSEKLEYQGRFFRNYMDMFENLLLFVRASRQGAWELHLSSLNEFVKYFFAHDQLNYARMTPLYLATMTELKESEEWNYLKENFSIAKSEIPFSAIGSDHAMEQENKVLKVNLCFSAEI